MSQTTFAQVPEKFDQLWDYSHPQKTEAAFRDYLAQSTLREDAKLQLMTQIARTQSLQRKFDEAHAILDKVKPELSVKTPVAEVRYLLERGRTFNSSKQQDKAIPLFKEAYELSLDRKFDNYAVDSAHMMGIAEKDPAVQLEWNYKALDLAEKSKDEQAQKWKGSLYNNIGWTQHDKGEFKKALEMFEKALELRLTQKSAANIRVAKWSVARTQRSLKLWDEALKTQLELEKELEAAKETDGFVFEELAELYELKGEKAKAKKYFGLAYEELSKDEWFKANEAVRLERLRQLK